VLPFQIISFGDAEANRYAAIRATLERDGEPIGPNDLIVAAITGENSGILITNNQREFDRAEGLATENWITQYGRYCGSNRAKPKPRSAHRTRSAPAAPVRGLLAPKEYE
jgi:hypothetical protein